jgi:tetratricopeptide (TPR) repeat protein
MNLMQQGDFAAAVTAFSGALQHHPEPFKVYLKRGVALVQLADFEAAIADFSAAIALAPQDACAYSYRGLARYQIDDLEGAMADWATALTLHPTDALVLYNRGLAYLQEGQCAEALADFDGAIAQNPLLAEAYLHRGNVKHMIGDLSGAIQDWEVALCNDLRLEEAQRLLAQVQQSHKNQSLQTHFVDLLPPDATLTVEQRDTTVILSLHRTVGTPISYFTLPNALRDRLVALQLPGVRHFRLVAQAGNSSLAEWDQTYGIYDKAPCPPARWRAALATTLLLFPPFGVVALVLASQVKPAYRRGDYAIAVGASQGVRKLFLSSSAIMGLMLFGLASYGVHTYVDGEYPNPAAKTTYAQKPSNWEKN